MRPASRAWGSALLLSVVLLTSVVGCGGDAPSYPNLPGGNPLVPEIAALPFPSDFYLTDDPGTPTGRRVAMTAEVMPPRVSTDLFDQDGFSVIAAILAYLPGGTDVASLPSPTDHAASVADESSVLLVREGTWERVGVLAELDRTTTDPARQAIILRPLCALDWNTGYVVILRDTLRRLDGSAHRAGDAFVALRDGIPTDVPEIEAQRDDFVLVNAAIAGAGLAPDDVVLAWSFHTRSETGTTDALVRMQLAVESATIDTYAITSDETVGDNRQIAGTFEAPNFVDPVTRLVELDAAGRPIQQGVRTVPFVATIPITVDEPRPTLVYGHGFLGNRTQATSGSFNDLGQTYRLNAVAVDFGFHEGIIDDLIAAFAGEWSRLRAVVAEVQQTFVNSTALARLVREHLSADILRDPGGGNPPFPVFDPTAVHYMGISNGGTFGYVMAATSPEIERAALVVGGGGLTHFLQRAVQWNEYGPLLDLFIRDPMDQQIAFALLQQLLDPIDSMSYARHLVGDRFPGMRPLRASVHMAIDDSQVRNLVTEWVMRTAGIPVIVPSPKPIWGLREIGADPPMGALSEELAVLHVYDEHVTPSPVTNEPPAADNGTHGTVRSLDVYKQHVGRFLTEGVFVHACSGPCDPD